MDILPNVTASITLKHQTPIKLDNWACYEWQVQLKNGKKEYSFPFYTGTGCVDKTKPRYKRHPEFHQISVSLENDGIKGPTISVLQLTDINKKNHGKWDYLLYEVKTPTKNEILHSLAMTAADMMTMPTFDEWCSDFGYNNDSIKAKNMFEACYEQTAKMKQLLSPTDFDTFITTDYDHIDEISDIEQPSV